VALKLAEAQFMRGETEERPILLLDDILSELDPARRGYVLSQAGKAGQTLITTTDLNDFGPEMLSRAAIARVEHGAVTLLDDAPSARSISAPEQPTNGEEHLTAARARRVAEQPIEAQVRPEPS
jgi:hypothetical protein